MFSIVGAENIGIGVSEAKKSSMEIGRWGDGTDGEMNKSLWARPWGQKQVCREHTVSETLGVENFSLFVCQV